MLGDEMILEGKKKINCALIAAFLFLNFAIVYNENWNWFILLYTVLLVIITMYFVKINTWENIVDTILVLCTSFLPMVVIYRYKESFYYGKAHYFIYFVLILLFTWWFKVIKKGYKPPNNLIDKLLGVYALLIVASTIFSVDIIQSLEGRASRREGTIVLLGYIFIMFITSKYYKYKRIHLDLFLLAAVVIVLYGFIHFYLDYDFLLGIELVGVAGAPSTLGHRNFFGSFVTIAMVISICAYLFTSKVRYYFSSLIIFGGILCSITRSTWVTFAIYFTFIAIYFWKNYKIKNKVVQVVLGFTLVFLLINWTSNGKVVNSRMESFSRDLNAISEKNASKLGSDRMFIWMKTKDLIFERPILGSGSDTLDIVFMKNYGEDVKKVFGDNITVDKAHNEVLQIMATVGLPAAIVYLFIVVYVLLRSWKLRENSIVFTTFCVICAYFIQAMFNISQVGIASSYWILMGLAVRYTSCESKAGDEGTVI